METKEQTIYVVTSGDYSDYSIDAVFTDKSLAEDFADTSLDYRIEEYTANEKVEKTERWWRVVLGEHFDEPVISRSDIAHDLVERASQKDKSYSFIVKSSSITKAKAIALERYHAFLAVKDTHFPFIDTPYIASEYGHNPTSCYLSYGYFDYKAYYIHGVNLRELFVDLMHVKREDYRTVPREPDALLAELKKHGLDLHSNCELERCSIF